jgi:hypothetical protein
MFLQSLMGAVNVEDQVQCKISRTVQEHRHLHPEASRRKSQANILPET